MTNPLDPLLDAIRDLSAWFSKEKLPFSFIGGIAVAFLGKPRATGDVDSLVLADEENLKALLQSASSYRIKPRLKDLLLFAKRHRILLLIHIPSSIEPGFCIRTRNSTNDAGLFRPQKVRPMSQIALPFFRRKNLGRRQRLIRLGSHA